MTITNKVHFDAMPGDTLQECLHKCFSVSKEFKCEVTLTFNGYERTINSATNIELMHRQWFNINYKK